MTATNRSEPLLCRQVPRGERQAALGYLMGSMAHELNNLNMVVTGNLELVLVQGPDEGSGVLLEKCRQSAWRSAEVMRALLALSDPISEYHQPGLQQVVAQMLVLHEQHFDKDGIAVEQISHDSPPVGADPLLLGQIVHAVLGLARQHVETAGDKRIEITCDVVGTRARCTVHDYGSGYSPEELRALLLSDESDEHSGRASLRTLGYAGCAQVAQRCGAELRVESGVERGTTVSLLVPVLGAADDRPLLVVIDDEPVIRQLIVDLLETNHVDVQPAESIEAAVSICGERRPDLLLTDLHLHDVAGADLVRTVQDRFADVPIVLMSGTVLMDEECAELGLPGVVGCLAKPFTYQRLIDALDEHIDL